MNHIDVLGLLRQYGLHTNKNLGQNFLKDPSVLEGIAKAALPFGENGILEIGAGIGSLTTLLCQRAKKVVTVEIDRSLQPLLEAQVPFPHHSFLWKDILECDYSALSGEYFSKEPFTIVGNLPYYITTEILSALLMSGQWNCAVLMVQKEVAERLLCPPGSKEYRALSVLTQAFCKGELLFEVPPHCFQPAPHVWSGVLRLTPKDSGIEDREGFARFVKSAFLARRKMFAASPAVQQALKMNKEQLSALLRSADLPENARGETFSPEQFINLYKLAQKNFL
ncbi:MAG: ribosomal RNA small subunit methyltransferase A [Clostridia bacterium]|nr:ribosomal RNA small subunit methyltransferase A [Clostridia bacterium]